MQTILGPLILPLVATSIAGIGSELRDYPIKPVPFTEVHVEDGFWTPRMETNRATTVWYDFQKCEETGRIDNFAKAGGLMPGEFQGCPFDDSDVFKVMEGAAYTLATHPDPKLDQYLDDLIAKIVAAQEIDGYLYTARTLKSGHSRAGKDRWLNERGGQAPGEDSHELYNLGHLYEAAAAHYEATGKTSLLDVARRSADLVARTWGPGRLEIPSGHQEIEIGLIKLYRVTGDEKYLNLAQFLLDCRGNGRHAIPGGHLDARYYSDHEPVTEQTEAVGHSVRSTYMYSAMTDVAAIRGDDAYARAVDALWTSVVGRKTYLTGGIGSDASTEGFGPDYALPNDGYNETCAAIGNALWNHRMFLLHGNAQYIDVLERIIYNGFLAGVAMTGDRFFYPNPLVCDGKRPFNHGSMERAPWFGCSCCPVNDVRFIPSIAGYIYAVRDKDLYVNLYMAGHADVQVAGTTVKLTEQTRYPWDGKVTLTVEPKEAARFTLNVRIPGWARNKPFPSDLYRYDDGLKPAVTLAVNGQNRKYRLVKGYARLRREWAPGDAVEIHFEMPVRRVVAHPKVKAAADSVALERGPLVYCAEGADNGGDVMTRTLIGPYAFSAEPRPDLLGGMVTVKATREGDNGPDLTLIPYYAWCHRGPNEMRVWFRATPRSWSASHCWPSDTVDACFDAALPKSSSDESIPRLTFWDHKGTAEWVERTFAEPTTVSRCEVYWFDDTGKGGCRVPASWRVLYLDGETWKPVKSATEYGTKPDEFNRVDFEPVTTTAIRLDIKLQPDASGGVLEWHPVSSESESFGGG